MQISTQGHLTMVNVFYHWQLNKSALLTLHVLFNYNAYDEALSFIQLKKIVDRSQQVIEWPNFT